MATVKSGINKVGNNYYQSITQDNPDGSVGTTFYRVDAQGNNGVPIYDVDKSAGSNALVKSFDPNATTEERRLLSDPNSQLSQVRSQQVISSNPYRDPIQGSAIAQAGGGSGNTASVAGTPDQQTGSTPTTQQQPQETSSGPLIYPLKMKPDQDRIKFQALTYAPKALPSQGFESIKPKYSPADIPVFLPIQASITDQNAVGWEPDTLNPIEKSAVGLSKNIMEAGGAEDVTGRVNRFFTEALEGLRASSPEVRTYLAGQAVGVNNLLSRLNGKVLNPNLELLFQGPQLRPFNFTFKLSPRSAEEAKVVKKIIRYFKKNMAPIVGDQGLFIKAPNIFKVEYQYGTSSPHPGINKIKECALTNCSVDYTPNGTYMTYPEGTMVSYTLSLQFQEIEPIYSRDYTDSDQIEF